MPFINITCPKCGGQSQIEAGRSAMCPYCASELNMPAGGDQGFAFAPQPEPEFMSGTQFANADLEFAEPEFVQPDIGRAAPAQMQQPNVYASPQSNPAQFMNPAMPYQQPVQQFPPGQLEAAAKKRRQWHFMNLGMLTVQMLVMLFAIIVEDYTLNENLTVMMIMAWLLSLPVCAILSGAMRPDEAYIDRKPLFKRKGMQGFMHFLISLPATAATAGVLYAIMNILHYMF